MILSTDRENAFDKIQHPFTITNLSKSGIEGNFLNLKRNLYEGSLTTNIILNDEKLITFALRLRTGKNVHSHHCYSTWY